MEWGVPQCDTRISDETKLGNRLGEKICTHLGYGFGSIVGTVLNSSQLSTLVLGLGTDPLGHWLFFGEIFILSLGSKFVNGNRIMIWMAIGVNIFYSSPNSVQNLE